MFCALVIIIIIIIINSIFKEDNVFSITASLPYGPPVAKIVGQDIRLAFAGPLVLWF